MNQLLTFYFIFHSQRLIAVPPLLCKLRFYELTNLKKSHSFCSMVGSLKCPYKRTSYIVLFYLTGNVILLALIALCFFPKTNLASSV